jgi:hypothetical protein
MDASLSRVQGILAAGVLAVIVGTAAGIATAQAE